MPTYDSSNVPKTHSKLDASDQVRSTGIFVAPYEDSILVNNAPDVTSQQPSYPSNSFWAAAGSTTFQNTPRVVQMASQDITFHSQNQEILRVTEDGTLKISDYAKAFPDEASKVFWETVAKISPIAMKKDLDRMKEEHARMHTLLNKTLKELAEKYNKDPLNA